MASCQCQEPGTPSESPTRLTGTQAFRLSIAASQDALEGSWTGDRLAGTQTRYSKMDVDIPSGSLTCCVATTTQEMHIKMMLKYSLAPIMLAKV